MRERQGGGGPLKGPKTRGSWWELGMSSVFNCVVLAAQRGATREKQEVAPGKGPTARARLWASAEGPGSRGSI